MQRSFFPPSPMAQFSSRYSNHSSSARSQRTFLKTSWTGGTSRPSGRSRSTWGSLSRTMGLFDVARAIDEQPLVVAYGMGVDSTSVLVEFARRKIRPDLILFANVGGPHLNRMGGGKEETYAYLPVMNTFLRAHGMPQVTVVRYTPKNFKNWPPYYSLEENCLTNGTLPSLAFGFKSCSLKWKASPQEKFVNAWQPAKLCWSTGRRVKKVIGYDCGPKDLRRQNPVGSMEDPRYEYWYP